jgi:serine/threonine protein kinase/formylglycine-generating enzyme required for sulfatase activity
MNPKLLALAARHQLSPEALQELLAAFLEGEAPSAAWFGGDDTMASEASAPSPTDDGTMETADELPRRAPRSPGAGILAEETPLASAAGEDARYEDIGLLGRGGMGEVRRIRDRQLGRTLAMKIAHRALQQADRAGERFVEEAQIGAQLQHPGVIPIHELGRLPDGRLYFTMQEIQGQELQEVIYEVHTASLQAYRWAPSPSGWTLRRLVSAFLRVCETMAYAHRRGIIHRDLKPGNIMVGREDEVLVVDWGLALVLEQERRRPAPEDTENPLETLRTSGALQQTSFGKISGTPAYMPPEQAEGLRGELDERSDVYALGAILYQILTGRPPYVGPGPIEILMQLLKGPPRHPQEVTRLPVPPELAEISLQAMAQDKAARYPDARALGDAVSAWFDGVLQREKALALVAAAEDHRHEAALMTLRAYSLRAHGEALLRDIPPDRPSTDKRAGWAAQDEAEDLLQRANLELIRAEQRLRGALIHAPDLPEAHEALALRYERLHREAEATKDPHGALRAEIVLRDHLAALPQEHPERLRLEAYLEGKCFLTLTTDPPGVAAALYRYTPQDRRLVPVWEGGLGESPLRRVELSPGSYLVILRGDGLEEVYYPVSVGRQEHWAGAPPGQHAPLPIWMPPLGELGPQERYVPAGWFWAGGDPEAPGAVTRRRLWCGGFIIDLHPVTNRQYLEFLNDLWGQGRADEALACVPRERAAAGDHGAPLYGLDEERGFFLRPDEEGDAWELDFPVVMINQHGARAFARWRAARTGQPWRLPLDFEWEKAARGVDGRLFPWGDHFDPSWCCMRASHAQRPMPATVDRFDADLSPYGVRGMAGNVIDMCLNPLDAIPEPNGVVGPPDLAWDEPDRDAQLTCRGGSWSTHDKSCRAARRLFNPPTMRQTGIGFRLVRDLPPHGR